MQYELFQGDCVETMRAMPDNSVDSIVTDPPYELTSARPGGRSPATQGKVMKGFMGMEWDGSGIAYSVEMWAEALRVLKPGGHLLAFSGSRTYHRMTCAIEDAGFEVRDQIMWVYGSGFPKSLDVSKAIDKARVEDVEPVRAVCRAVRAAMDAKGWKSRDLTPHFDNCHPRLIDHWAARDTDSQPSLPTTVQWEKLRELLALGGTHDSEVARLNGRKGDAGDVYQNAEVLGEHAGNVPGLGGERFGVADTSIRARSDAARQWEGWGTALKPAHEPICVARKPLIGTVAANVLAHGTGALNIDGCRVGESGATRKIATEQRDDSAGCYGNGLNGGGGERDLPYGRWPANLIHSGCPEVLALFPESSTTGKRSSASKAATVAGTAWLADNHQSTEYTDSGSAARFFYCAKTSKADRGANSHPTVKPTELMAYLCRLVTPPGGLILDPFMGSGSTGKAAMREGFRFIGCELSAEYLAIAEARISHELIGDLL